MNIGNWLVNFLLGFVVGKQFSFGPINISIDGQNLTAQGNFSIEKAA